MGLCWALAACGSDPLAGPIDLFHNLEGGQIAAQRPPPPGVGQPYPKLGTVPARPVVADQAYRRSLQAQLTSERDRTERVAADKPIEHVPPPPGPEAVKAPQAATANATLDTAEAPAPVPRTAVAQPAGRAPAVTGIGPPAGTPLTIAGVPADTSGLPPIPDAPPPPATFEGVPAEPAPTPRVIPVSLPAAPAGTQVFFGAGNAVLPPSQVQVLRDFANHRGARRVEIVGLGEAGDDSPEGQATAVALGLARARTVADALAGLHVPQGAMRVGADAFGRGAVLRLLP